MRQQTLLFDLDDTLVHCNKYFKMIVDRFAEIVVEWFADYGITLEDVKQKQLEIDLKLVNIHGFTTEHFPISFVDTYAYFSDLHGRYKDQQESELLIDLGSSVYEQEVEPYPQMHETLQLLQKEGHRLYLYTGGVEAIQRRKVERLGLQTYFEDRIFVAQHKNVDALRSILATQQFETEQTWMIGNSVRTDILPALELGIHAVYIPAQLEWEYNMAEVHIEHTGAFYTISLLDQVPIVIQKHTAQSPL